MINRNKTKILLLIIGDFIVLYAALSIALLLRYYPASNIAVLKEHFIPFGVNFLLWLLLFGAFGLYELRSMKNSRHFGYRLIQALAASAISSTFLFYFFPLWGIEPRRNLILIIIISALFLFMWRYLFNVIIIKNPPLRIIFFGANQEIVKLADYLLQNPQLGHKPVGFILNNDSQCSASPEMPIYNIEHGLDGILKSSRAGAIVITNNIKENKTLVKVLFQVIPKGIAVLEFDAFHEMLTGKIPLSLIEEVWFLENLIGIKKQFYAFSKRALDWLLAILIVLPLLAILPIMAFFIKIDSVGPVFFKQKRVGKNGKIFELIKFRSMVKDAEYIGGLKGEGYDVRLTRVGRFLRRSYIDELPQIINIAKGEMSFIGPRPERPEYVEELKKIIPFYEMRLLATPGITGWAQINMENDASVEDAPEKIQYDLYYIKNRSFVLDILIALKTMLTILHRPGR